MRFVKLTRDMCPVLHLSLNSSSVLYKYTVTIGWIKTIILFGKLTHKINLIFSYAYADQSWLTNGFLDQVIDWVPGFEGIRLRDLPNNFITTNP